MTVIPIKDYILVKREYKSKKLGGIELIIDDDNFTNMFKIVSIGNEVKSKELQVGSLILLDTSSKRISQHLIDTETKDENKNSLYLIKEENICAVIYK